MFQTEIVKNIKTHFTFNNFSPKIVPFTRERGKIWYNQTDHTWQYGAEKKRFACRINKARVQKHTHNI